MLIPSECDVRICTADTRFCTWNDHDNPCHEATKSVRDIVHNKGLLREFAIAGKEFDASEANQMGFISTVRKSKNKAVAEGQKTAKIITSRPPEVVQHLVRNTSSQTFLHGMTQYFVYVLCFLSRTLSFSTKIQKIDLLLRTDYTEEQAQIDINQALGVGSMRWAKSLL